MLKNVVVIVDGFNAGKAFPVCLKRKGYESIHLSSIFMEDRAFNKEQYIDHFTEQKNLKYTLNQFKDSYNVEAVIAGSESGVLLAHQIAQQLKLRRNEDKKIQATRNKYLMQKELEHNNISHVKTFKSDDLKDIEQWAKAHNKFPVVVKPLDSGGSDNVHICNNLQNISHAYNQIIANNTIYGTESSQVLIQEFLSGTEYVVNLVSSEGKHHLLEIRKYHKQTFNGRHIYDYEELLDFDGELQKILVSYAKDVASALGIKYGPSHIEIIVTSEGPKLVELASRISGATNTEVSNIALGYNVIDLTIDSYLTHIDNVNNFCRKKELIIDIATNKKGKIIAIPFKDELTTFKSVKNVHFKVDIGDELTPTISLPTSPVKLHLVHEDSKQLLQDKDKLKELAKNGFVVE